MWYSVRHEGFDNEGGPHKMSMFGKVFYRLVQGYLRMGLLMQLIALSTLIGSHYMYKGEGFFTWDLSHTIATTRESSNFRLLLCSCSVLYLFGSLSILGFYMLNADDAGYARGYRAGAKLLGGAVTMDILASIMQCALYTNMYTYYSEAYWTHFREGNLDWIFGCAARVLHGLAMILYSQSFLLLEIYHDRGTSDAHGIANLYFFSIAGIAEIFVLFIADQSAAVGATWLALVSALIWSMAFEGEAMAVSPALNECELTNDVEQQVEKFARLSPFEMQKLQR